MTFAWINDARLGFNRFASHLQAYELAALTVIVTLSVMVACRWLSCVCASDQTVWQMVKSSAFRVLIRLPVIRGIASKEITKAVCSFAHSFDY